MPCSIAVKTAGAQSQQPQIRSCSVYFPHPKTVFKNGSSDGDPQEWSVDGRGSKLPHAKTRKQTLNPDVLAELKAVFAKREWGRGHKIRCLDEDVILRSEIETFTSRLELTENQPNLCVNCRISHVKHQTVPCVPQSASSAQDIPQISEHGDKLIITADNQTTVSDAFRFWEEKDENIENGDQSRRHHAGGKSQFLDSVNFLFLFLYTVFSTLIRFRCCCILDACAVGASADVMNDPFPGGLFSKSGTSKVQKPGKAATVRDEPEDGIEKPKKPRPEATGVRDLAMCFKTLNQGKKGVITSPKSITEKRSEKSFKAGMRSPPSPKTEGLFVNIVGPPTRSEDFRTKF